MGVFLTKALQRLIDVARRSLVYIFLVIVASIFFFPMGIALLGTPSGIWFGTGLDVVTCIIVWCIFYFADGRHRPDRYGRH